MIRKLKKQILSLLNIKKDNTTNFSEELIADSENYQTRVKGEANSNIRRKQSNLLMLLMIGGIVSIFIIINLVQSKRKEGVKNKEDTKVKVVVAADAIDPQEMWFTHFEDKLHQSQQSFEERLKAVEESFTDKEKELLEMTKIETQKLREQLKFAKEELNSAAIELGKVREMQESKINNEDNYHKAPNLTSMDFGDKKEIDIPKSTKNYIPETTYVSGYLLGGLSVSTGVNTPNENATPVVIRLTKKGNLSPNSTLDISTCRILGSSYGDLSSERAIIRAEKMICEDKIRGLVTTSNVSGIIHGPDGNNGIKGKIVATSSRHLKNALIGGGISGLTNSAKGQDGMSITSLGAINTPKKGFKQLAGEGLMSGASNASEKLAEYYLRQAEQMAPVLTIPGGVKVDVVFTKGFYIGELSTHSRIEGLRKKNQQDFSSND